jgi:hypothetical protein
LTTYAGLALGLRKLAADQSGEQERLLINKSLNLRQKVMSEDPVKFQVNALAKNWLWSESMIQDWQELIIDN